MRLFFLVKQNRLKILFYFTGLILGYLFLEQQSFAVTVAELQAPIEGLKSEIFGGWMKVVQIAAAASGIIMSVFRGSLTPFGIGAGLAVGIHLYDGYLGTGAAGALI